MAELWETAITQIKPNEIRVRGYRIDELMGKMTFSQVIYLLFTGELPGKEVSDLLDAIFISSIDHGVTPPSALAVRNATSTGAPLNAAVASGILCINDFHGGAIFNAMGEIQSALNQAGTSEQIDAVAKELVNGWLKGKKRFPGVGHRIHTDDPRTRKLFELAETAGVSGDGVCMMKAIAREFAEQGKPLPINVDGAIAAVLIDLHIPQDLANAFFMIARLPGMCAHAYEEKTTQPRMRTISPAFHVYTGAENRTIEE